MYYRIFIHHIKNTNNVTLTPKLTPSLTLALTLILVLTPHCVKTVLTDEETILIVLSSVV